MFAPSPQNCAISVCSGVRTELFALPIAFTSARSFAYWWLVSAGGAGGMNCEGDDIAHGVMSAKFRSVGPANSGSVGCHDGIGWTTYGGSGVVRPSVLRDARTAAATVCPHARPSAIDCGLPWMPASDVASCASKVDFCEG